MSISNYFIVFFAILMMAGCAAQGQYAWQNYDQKLYNHYKNPAKSEQFIEDLKDIIQYGEEGGKVPPGIYAEYGYALYEQGNYHEAIEYFKKEQAKWPESNIIMTKMINNAQKKLTQINK
ncbi:MAG: hypothetical protein BWY90_00458 [Deltaproteobacteria bacterium ADurb.BinA014]|jgi:hypothetical protein|nr:DUF4810 domain-containing protein [Sedimentibacter sp.]OPZ53837.1 MAG: hypothetical protein BWY90_00458 [Deltaproteobacteria bacterium ADurb.BinA014]